MDFLLYCFKPRMLKNFYSNFLVLGRQRFKMWPSKNILKSILLLNTASKILIILFAFIVRENKACLLHLDHEEEPEPWTKRMPRKPTDKHCECGQDPIFPEELDPQIAHNYPDKPWLLYIHVKDKQYNSHIRTCTGSVINTKMIFTSSNCLRFSRVKIPPYEAWHPLPENTDNILAKAENIEVSRTGDYPIKDPSNAVPVVDILYRKDWILHHSNAEDDIATIVMKDPWDTDTSPPICIPQEINIDPTGFKGYYYGVGGDLEPDPNPELRIVGDAVILPGRLCDMESRAFHTSGIHPLCIQYRVQPPTTTGGPLIMSINGEVNNRGFTPFKTVYLVGLASIAESNPTDFPSTIVTTYFSNIIPHIPYLEYYADKLDAKWCQTPDMALQDSNRVQPLMKGLKKKYEWEGDSLIKRDESLNCVCGIHNTDTTRIAGGVAATPYEFPWLVFIFLRWQNHAGEAMEDSSGACGGAIINDRMILTAAHCVIRETRLVDSPPDESLPDEVEVYYRKHDTIGDTNQVEVKIAKIYYMGDYVQGAKQGGVLFSIDGDIALIELETPLVFSDVMQPGQASPQEIRPICLPRPENHINVVGIQDALVAGWGVNGPAGSDPDTWAPPQSLMKLVVPIVPLEECARRTAVPLRDSVICAGYFNREKDSSLGDSGGPLQIRHESGYWTEVGLVSFGRDEYEDTGVYNHTVALYTNVQKYLRFVDYYSNKVGAKWCHSRV